MTLPARESHMKHLNLTIIGRVQGVFFRARAKQKADELGLAGWVRNSSDGSVRAEIEGEDDAVNSFVAWCREGSGSAAVERVHAEEGSVKGLEGFEIRI
jgi:acylphosphatase